MTTKLQVSREAALAANRQLSQAYARATATAASAGSQLLFDLAQFFDGNPPELVQAATDRKVVGVAQGSTEAVVLSQTRAVYRVWQDRRMEFDGILSRAVADGKGWASIMADVREVASSIKAAKAEAADIKAAVKVAAELHRGDEKAQAEYVEKYREARAIRKAEEAAQPAEAPDPETVARRVAKRWIEKMGLDFAREAAALMVEAVEAEAREMQHA